MSISAAMVKELRERTGSGMMECKKALTETGGDIEAAVELMRKQGLAKADKKAGRTAAEGTLVVAAGDKAVALVEVNCETDFVAKGDEFQGFAAAVAASALTASPADLDALLAAPLADGKSVDEIRREKVAKIGENIAVRRFVRYESAGGVLASYLHGTRIGVLVELAGGDEELAKDVAMHIAASRPLCVSPEQVPAEVVEKEREIALANAVNEGKSPEIAAKMVEGRVRKFLNENTLLGQVFIKDPEGKQTVAALLKGRGASVVAFTRYELGEGIEKKQENFADEVMAQVRGS
ncbi:translation elongation factor Ts [Plasticicumulans sp.]|uniref:translation elongation factor Ts n=1 Tax=Plasticicumulans sp. TaxID=2307179 RepID=UPI000F90AA02|nr:translation elongation factor Ts [Plasticicumulans sp.]RTK96810.1 MAG: elongation factor Ts [Xanthomonadales bacterium]HMX53166.1 translation elongation factor Ts [Plasticicumulans sp.]HMZ10651.1 translation elongation factor Ts [Plasticicumulans sp.]HNB89623.1 translation elongation factor Ts [Plasticicumulans sp.]HNF64297.1 translation elongation factor Ts [Plasticicumulans sp.]